MLSSYEKPSIALTQQKILSSIRSAHTSPQRLARRSGIIMDYAASGNAKATAEKYSVYRDIVYLWVKRWCQSSSVLDAWEKKYRNGSLSLSQYQHHIEEILTDAQRPGRPSVFSEKQKKEIIAVSKRTPEQEGVLVTHWTHNILARHVSEKGIVPSISSSRLGSFLKRRPV